MVITIAPCCVCTVTRKYRIARSSLVSLEVEFMACLRYANNLAYQVRPDLGTKMSIKVDTHTTQLQFKCLNIDVHFPKNYGQLHASY